MIKASSWPKSGQSSPATRATTYSDRASPHLRTSKARYVSVDGPSVWSSGPRPNGHSAALASRACARDRWSGVLSATSFRARLSAARLFCRRFGWGGELWGGPGRERAPLFVRGDARQGLRWRWGACCFSRRAAPDGAARMLASPPTWIAGLAHRRRRALRPRGSLSPPRPVVLQTRTGHAVLSSGSMP